MIKLLLALAITALFTVIAISEDRLPLELDILEGQYEREMERVTKPVKQKYQKALQDLKARYTQQGKLTKALAVEARIQGNQFSGTVWSWGKGETIEFKDGLVVNPKWPIKVRWLQIEPNVVALIADRKTERFALLEFNFKSKTYQGKNFDGRQSSGAKIQ